LKRRTAILLLGLTAGCASGRPKIPLVSPVDVTDKQVRIAAEDLAAASVESISHTLGTVCKGPCEVLYVDATPDTSTAVLFKVVDAVSVMEQPVEVFLLGSSDKRVLLDVGDDACAVEIEVEPNGVYVSRDGERMEPDSGCSQWDATVCRGDDGQYDWPRLRSALGDQERVCISPGPTVVDIDPIHLALRQPVVRLVRPARAESTIDAATLAAVVKRHGADLQWCLEGEVVDEPAPASALLQLVVHVDGTITRAEVLNSTRGTPQFETCLTEVAQKKFRFDPPGAGEPVVVQLRLAFQPGERRPSLTE
jgi:hypothetical protein